MDYSKITPMLAAGKPKDWDMGRYIQYLVSKGPMIATPKIDGIRCICKSDGFPLTRTLKDIPNGFIRAYFFEHRDVINPCFDGELTVGRTFQECSSGIMSFGGEPDFTYHIFDAPSDKPYLQRCNDYIALSDAKLLPERFVSVPTCKISSVNELYAFEEFCLRLGFEGVMLRTANSPYKSGRSTVKQAWLMKLKRFESAEAVVVGFDPLMHNANPAEVNAVGHLERSSHKSGMVAKETLGKLRVQGINKGFEGVNFSIGSGFDQAQRDCFWENKEKLLGKFVEFKYQPHGVKDAPRCPIFLRFRNAEELI